MPTNSNSLPPSGGTPPEVDPSLLPQPWPPEALQAGRVAARLAGSVRPYVSLKAAVTLDGKIATADGESRWITGETARRHGHGLRACHDGILVGSGTVLSDDPQLTVRLSRPAPNPTRIVLDSRCRIDPAARCLADDGAERIVVVGAGADAVRVTALRARGVRVLQCAGPRPTPAEFLPALRACGVQRLLVEGGAAVHANIIALGRPDELFLYQAGKIIGGPDARGWCEDIGVRRLAAAPLLRLSQPRLVGEDVLLHGVFLAAS